MSDLIQIAKAATERLDEEITRAIVVSTDVKEREILSKAHIAVVEARNILDGRRPCMVRFPSQGDYLT